MIVVAAFESPTVVAGLDDVAVISQPVEQRGHLGDGEHWTVIASLIGTCKLIGVEPHAYLADVITRIVNGHPNSQIDDLLPWV